MYKRTHLLALLVLILTGLPLGNAMSATNSILIPKKDLMSNDESLKTFAGHGSYVESIALSADGKYLATGSYDDTAKLWDVETGKVLKTFKGHSGDINAVALSSDGKYLATGSEDKTARLWDIESGEMIKKYKIGDNVASVLFSPDGKFLAIGSWDKIITLRNVETGKVYKRIKGSSGLTMSMAFSPDGKYLARGKYDGLVEILDVEKGIVYKTFNGHSVSVHSVAFSPDGKYLATGSDDETATIWNFEPGKLLKTLKGHSEAVRTVAFSPDGKYLATGGSDSMAKIWDIETGEIITALKHSSFVKSMVFTSDGKNLFTGSWDYTAKMWDVGGKNTFGSLFNIVPKGEFEKTNSYNERVAELRSQSLPYSMKGKLHSYDADSETYKIKINDKDYSVSVPIAKAKEINGKNMTVKVDGNVRYYDNNNGEFINPVVYHEGTNFKSRVLGFKKVTQKSFSGNSNTKSKQSASDSEAMFWSSIEFSKDANDFKAYLKQYPNGAFAALAESKAAKYMKLVNKETLVLMPIKTTGIADDMRSSMESAVVEGLNNKYKVYAGSQVRKKVKEIFTKESRNTKAGKKCDETKCMQDIAIAFNCELIGTSRVIKNQGGFVLSIDVRNIFDDVSVYSKSVPCKNCDEFQAIEKLKTLVR